MQHPQNGFNGGMNTPTPYPMNQDSMYAQQQYNMQQQSMHMMNQPQKRDRLIQGQKLDTNEQLVSGNGVFNAIMQKDGNLVVYHRGSKAIWASNTYGPNGQWHVTLQTDGNLVVYNPINPGVNENPKWASNSMGTNCVLTMQDDGNLVLYDGF